MSPNQDRLLLKDLLTRKSVQTGRIFKLVSGAESTYYVDAKRTTCAPQAMPLVGRLFLRTMEEQGWAPDAVGGLTLGADPIAFSVARESLDTGRPINAFIVRKEPKRHGMAQFIEGLEQTEGLQVVVLDDVCTKGGSTGDAIEKARKAGMNVLGAICLVDREEGATDLLRDKFGVTLARIFTIQELLSYKEEQSGAAHPVASR